MVELEQTMKQTMEKFEERMLAALQSAQDRTLQSTTTHWQAFLQSSKLTGGLATECTTLFEPSRLTTVQGAAAATDSAEPHSDVGIIEQRRSSEAMYADYASTSGRHGEVVLGI